VELGAQTGSVAWEICEGEQGYRMYSRKREEFAADFCLVSQRSLDEFEYKVLRYHYLLGAGWNFCCQRLNIDRGTFYHALYRIENRLGRIFADVEPYALYPVDEYFAGFTRKDARREAVSEFDAFEEQQQESLLLSA
jgi:hypothetical protein